MASMPEGYDDIYEHTMRNRPGGLPTPACASTEFVPLEETPTVPIGHAVSRGTLIVVPTAVAPAMVLQHPGDDRIMRRSTRRQRLS